MNVLTLLWKSRDIFQNFTSTVPSQNSKKFSVAITINENMGGTRIVIIIPALAGFQSEHEVEIPFMLTTEENSETYRTGIKNAVDWEGLGIFYQLEMLMGRFLMSFQVPTSWNFEVTES